MMTTGARSQVSRVALATAFAFGLLTLPVAAQVAPATGQGNAQQPQAQSQTPVAVQGQAPVVEGQGASVAPAVENKKTIAQIVTENVATPQNIPALVTPIILANPQSAADLIAAGVANPKIRPRLAQILADIQQFLRKNHPDAAKIIAAQVAAAPAPFQAEYAVALAAAGRTNTTGGAATGTGNAGGVAGNNGTLTNNSSQNRVTISFGGFSGTPVSTPPVVSRSRP